MAEYTIIDEIRPDKTQTKDPWNPWAVFGFTVFAGPLFGGVMGLINYGRLNIKGKEYTIALLLIIASMSLPFLPMLGFEKFGMHLTKDISKQIFTFVKFILAYYFVGTQKNHFNYHMEMGGGKASIKIPILVCVGFVIIFFMIAGILAGIFGIT